MLGKEYHKRYWKWLEVMVWRVANACQESPLSTSPRALHLALATQRPYKRTPTHRVPQVMAEWQAVSKRTRRSGKKVDVNVNADVM
jgi:hypothetical protein